MKGNTNNKVLAVSQKDSIQQEKSSSPASLKEIYYTDLNGIRISSIIEKKVKLVIETTNMIGDLIDINFNDEFFNFKYNGQILENDILKNYRVNSNRDEIELEVLEETK